MQMSQTFLTYNKTNSILLKFNHSLLRMPKIIEIGWHVSAKNPIQKHNQRANKYVRTTLKSSSDVRALNFMQ